MDEPRSLVLVVRPPPSDNPQGGDEVMYRRTLDYLTARLGKTPDVIALQAATRIGRLSNLFRFPAEVARYVAPANVARVKAVAGGYRCVLFFHEFSFPAARAIAGTGARGILVAHNVHSLIASSDPSRLIRATKGIARRFERRHFTDRALDLVLISHGDHDALIRAGVIRDDIQIAPPGAPPEVHLRSDATVSGTLVLTGSYGWWRKRRDLRRLASEVSPPGSILATDPAALSALGTLGAPLAEGFDWSESVRFGLISDRFLGGFKLKALEYIANNCVIVSFADLSREFEGVPYAEMFVRHVSTLAEAWAVIESLANGGADVIDKFRQFKAACLERYRWDHALRPLGDLVVAAVDGARQ